MSARAETLLDRIVAETREEVEHRKRDTLIETDASVARRGRFHDALAGPGIAVIAEFKRRSPSAGWLHEDADVEQTARAYERGGASALSVLTEGPNFGGSLGDLRAAREACGLPILRKDFIVDPYQLHEARAARADAVLLIVAALDQDELASLHELAGVLGLDVLVEVHDSEELARAARIGARLIGVNNRDLRDFTVDVRRTSQLMGEMPSGAIVVSESGIAHAEQVTRLERQGVSALLVGETLMRAADPGEALAVLLSGSVKGGTTKGGATEGSVTEGSVTEGGATEASATEGGTRARRRPSTIAPGAPSDLL
jgi:indole-3-glycerol phosphate synthase